MTSSASPATEAPIAAIRLSRIATSPAKDAAPVPSTTVPPRIRRSNRSAMACSSRSRIGDARRPEPQTIRDSAPPCRADRGASSPRHAPRAPARTDEATSGTLTGVAPTADPPPRSEDPPPRWIGRGLRPLIAGSLALFPLVATILVVVWVADLAQTLLGPSSRFGRLLREVGLNFVVEEFTAYLIGLGITLALIYGLGLLVASSLESGWYAVTDRIMRHVPLVSTIYDAARRFVTVLGPRDESDMRGMTPVVCHFGGRGGSAILGLLPSPQRIRLGERDYLAVMIPSAPVPVGGLLVYVPAEWVEPAGFSVDGLINVYVSMGVTSSQYFPRASDAAQPARSDPNEGATPAAPDPAGRETSDEPDRSR